MKSSVGVCRKYAVAFVAALLGISLQWVLLTGIVPGNFLATVQSSSAACNSNTLPSALVEETRVVPISPAPIQRAEFQTGMIFPQWGTTAYSSEDANWKIGLNEIQEQTGARWIELPINLFQPSLTSTRILVTRSTPTPQAMAEGIHAARAMHYHVFVTPQLTVGGARPWSGDIQFPTAQQTRAWFDNYWSAFEPYVIAASRAGAEQLAIGTEYEQLEQAPPSLWNQLIRRMHTAFPGRLTYNMNWSSITHPIPSWMENPSLSAIGVSEYIPLSDVPQRLNPVVLPDLWREKVKPVLDSLALEVGKPVLISEIGYRDSTDALYNTWERSTNAPADPVEQAAAYNAALMNVTVDPHIAGIFVWAWSFPLFEPNCRPAAQVLHQWFTST